MILLRHMSEEITPQQLLDAVENPYKLLSKWVLMRGGWTALYKVFGYVSAQSFNEAFSRRATKNRWTGKGLRTHLSILVHLDNNSPELVQKNSTLNESIEE